MIMFWLTRTDVVDSELSLEAYENFFCLIVLLWFLSEENALLSELNWWSWQISSLNSDCNEIILSSSVLEFLNKFLLFSSSWSEHLSESSILLIMIMSSCSDATKWYEKVVLVLSETFTENKSSSILLLLLLMTRSIWYSHYCLRSGIDNNSLSFQLLNILTNNDHMIFWLIKFHT